MSMTVGKLIKALNTYPPDAELRIAHQPHWPFSYAVYGVASDTEVRELQDSTWREGEAIVAVSLAVFGV